MHTLKNTMNEREEVYIVLTTLDASTIFLLISNEISKKKI